MIIKLILLLAAVAQAQRVVYEWKYLNFTWPSAESHGRALAEGSYQPNNTVITGIKVWKDEVYLTLPRWKRGVPATLVRVSPSGGPSPLLEPYPSWDWQRLDDCRAFQYVQSMEIDPLGRMWVIDNGRTEFITDAPRTKCPARLVILDLENDGRVLLEYVFPAHVVDRNSVFLNDIVLDHEDGGYAYITDHDNNSPGIVVFSLLAKQSWKVRHARSMNVDPNATKFLVNGTQLETSGPVDGIALSPPSLGTGRTLYYTPLTSYELFELPVWVLKLPGHANPADHVRLVGRKSSQTDGMVIATNDDLYYGLLTEDAVSVWNTGQPPFPANRRLVARDAELNQWPDTFAIDEAGRLWWTSNRLQEFFNDKVDTGVINCRVISMDIGCKSYQYHEDGGSPALPGI